VVEIMLTINEVAKQVNVGDDLIRAAIADGSLRCVRFGHRTVRVTQTAVDAWVASNAVAEYKPAPEPPRRPATIKKKRK
jgi:excisionase family DNA binding protein